MNNLIDGYRRFRNEIWPGERARYETLARKGQRPETLVIACSDSRVDPQTVFGAGPGEMFVLRNIAGLVPPYQPDANYHGTSAAVEYGVRVLKVSRVVVLGHAQCGGVRAMIEGVPREATDFVEQWTAIADPIIKAAPPHLDTADMLVHVETEVVKLSLANLRTFPWIASAEAAGTLTLQGFRFDIRTGVLMELRGNEFASVAEQASK